MSVKLRLARRGRRKKPFYHIVVADARAPRDGRFIEKIGSYNPLTVPATIELNRDRAFEWLQKGAQPTDTVRSILRFKGVLYRAHLMRGVAKGALTEEKAQKLYEDFVASKEEKIKERMAKTEEEIKAFRKKVAGVRKVIEVAEEVPAENNGEDAQAIPEDSATDEEEAVAPAEAEAEAEAEEKVVAPTEKSPAEEVVAEEATTEATEKESKEESKEENPE